MLSTTNWRTSTPHRFTASEADGERCASCGLYRGAHEDTGFTPGPGTQNLISMDPGAQLRNQRYS